MQGDAAAGLPHAQAGAEVAGTPSPFGDNGEQPREGRQRATPSPFGDNGEQPREGRRRAAPSPFGDNGEQPREGRRRRAQGPPRPLALSCPALSWGRECTITPGLQLSQNEQRQQRGGRSGSPA